MFLENEVLCRDTNNNKANDNSIHTTNFLNMARADAKWLRCSMGCIIWTSIELSANLINSNVIEFLVTQKNLNS